jgi:transaldolase
VTKAISKGEGYDEQIEALVRQGLPVAAICERLVVSDVQEACDVLRPVFETSAGLDGYVSLEVSPYLAHDTEGSLNEARKLHRLVERPNVFIKIPGTRAGVAAIEQALFEGIHINITLLFSIASYEARDGSPPPRQAAAQRRRRGPGVRTCFGAHVHTIRVRLND